MAETNCPFERLPIEMQRNLMSFLSKKDILSFRLVSKGCHQVSSHNVGQFTFESCTLSDATSPFVLKSKESVREICVNSFMRTPQSGISSTRGTILSRTSELTLGKKIHPVNLSKVLEYVGDVQGLGFQSPDKAVVDTFLSFKRGYDFVTKLSFNLNVNIEVREEYVTLFNQLANSKRFPQLKTFVVDWNGSRDDTREINAVEGLRAYSLYLSVHKILLNHISTIEVISWNLCGLRVTEQIVVRGLYKRIEEYRKIKTMLGTFVQLKEIYLKKSECEGTNYNDLSNSLLMGQRQLEKLHYMVPIAQPMHHPNFAPVSSIIRNNKATLIEVDVDCPVFAFFWLDGCNNLKKLTLTAWHFATTPINSIPREITEINLDVKYLFTEEATAMIAWVKDNLMELRTMKLSFKLLFASTAAFPSPELFQKLFKPPKLENLTLTYWAESASENYLVQIKLKRLLGLCKRRRGIRVKKIISQNNVADKFVTKYEVQFLVNRETFKGFPGQ